MKTLYNFPKLLITAIICLYVTTMVAIKTPMEELEIWSAKGELENEIWKIVCSILERYKFELNYFNFLFWAVFILSIVL